MRKGLWDIFDSGSIHMYEGIGRLQKKPLSSFRREVTIQSNVKYILTARVVKGRLEVELLLCFPIQV